VAEGCWLVLLVRSLGHAERAEDAGHSIEEHVVRTVVPQTPAKQKQTPTPTTTTTTRRSVSG